MLPLCQQIFKFIQGNALFLRKLLRSFAYQQDMRARHHSPRKRDWIFNELNSSHSSYPQRMALHYAGIMEGHTLRIGAVAAVEFIKNPISLARRVMASPHVLLVGKGAQEFAQEQGIPDR